MTDDKYDLDAPSLLDPEDWQSFRNEAHRALDKALDFVQQRPAAPVWREIPEEIKAAGQAVPLEGSALSDVVDEVSTTVLPYSLGNTHPRFWGWVHGSGTASGLVSQKMIAALNANMGGREHAPMYIERQLMKWLHEIFDMPGDASGVMVTGTSMATLLGLSVARQRATGGSCRRGGNGDLGLVAYTSEQSHVSVSKAIEIMGLGSSALRSIPVNADYSMDCSALRERIDYDRRQGLTPFAVVSTIGSVNTGAIDDLVEIEAICTQRGLWHHVDGAFGALAVLSEELKSRVEGLSSADSIAFDFHKWMHVGYACGCLLVREGELHRATFAKSPSYLQGLDEGIAGGAPWPTDYSLDLSRGFMALAVWFQMKELGVVRLGRAIYRNCLQAEWLAQEVISSSKLELIVPVTLNIVCFRFCDTLTPATDLDRLNQRIVVELQCRGIAAPSTTVLKGKTVIRVCITNHRTRKADLEVLLASVDDIAAELLAAGYK